MAVADIVAAAAATAVVVVGAVAVVAAVTAAVEVAVIRTADKISRIRLFRSAVEFDSSS
jgi:hypothetical protein